MKQYILALDQGTTGSRAIVYDKNGNKIASSYQEFPQHFPHPGWVEHDPEDIWNSVYSSIQKVLAEVPSRSISAIGITNQRETTIVWDNSTGKPIYNAIVWQCRRTAERCDRLKKNKNIVHYIKQKTGLPVDAYFSSSKIEWILNNVPPARKKAQEGKLYFGTPNTWLLWKLTGGKIHATDYTNAARTMLFNIETLDWDDKLLKLFNVPKSMLPEVKPSSGIFGYTARLGRLPEGIPISGMVGDQQAALFGQACFEPGTMNATYGTGGFILLNTGKKKVISKHGLITTIGCNGQGHPTYVLEGSTFISGASIQWLRDELKIIHSASESESMATALSDNEGVYFVPALVGLGAPYWDEDVRGIITGITRGTTRNHLVRAALESMCYQTKDILLAMQKDSGLKINHLKVDGGAVANNFLCQFQSDILNVKVVRPKVIETTSLGAAYLAGLAVGYWKHSAEIQHCWKEDRMFKPKMPKATSKKLYSGWKVAIKKTLVR